MDFFFWVLMPLSLTEKTHISYSLICFWRGKEICWTQRKIQGARMRTKFDKWHRVQDSNLDTCAAYRSPSLVFMYTLRREFGTKWNYLITEVDDVINIFFWNLQHNRTKYKSINTILTTILKSQCSTIKFKSQEIRIHSMNTAQLVTCIILLCHYNKL